MIRFVSITALAIPAANSALRLSAAGAAAGAGFRSGAALLSALWRNFDWEKAFEIAARLHPPLPLEGGPAPAEVRVREASRSLRRALDEARRLRSRLRRARRRARAASSSATEFGKELESVASCSRCAAAVYDLASQYGERASWCVCGFLPWPLYASYRYFRRICCRRRVDRRPVRAPSLTRP